MGDFVTWLGQLCVWVGLPLAVGAQIVAFLRILNKSPVKAVLALMVPGYFLYYIWRSKERMPGLLRVWVSGFVLFVIGMVIVGLAMEM